MAVKDQTILKNHYYYIRDTKILSKLKLSHFILYLISHPLEEELLLKKIQVLRYNIQRGQIRQKKISSASKCQGNKIILDIVAV